VGARVLGAGAAVEVLRAWLAEEFEGGRYAQRLEMMRGGYKGVTRE
jgi:ribose 5-phosphate isomerase RpiB